MLIHVPAVLNPGQLAECRHRLDAAGWVDGRATAGHDAAKVKSNEELPGSDPAAAPLVAMVQEAVSANPYFRARALPRHIVPPGFSRYRPGQTYGTHVDSGMMTANINGVPTSVRIDLAATLFLSDPVDYDGGALSIQDTFGQVAVKLAAGDMVLYPASSLHGVEPVTRGTRLAAVLWVQSMIRGEREREMLDALRLGISEVRQAAPDNPAVVRLIGLHHNLLRLWSEN